MVIGEIWLYEGIDGASGLHAELLSRQEAVIIKERGSESLAVYITAHHMGTLEHDREARLTRVQMCM